MEQTITAMLILMSLGLLFMAISFVFIIKALQTMHYENTLKLEKILNKLK